MTWKFDDNRSIYAQLVEQIQIRIMTGVYEAGSKLPSVRELASEAGVNPNTMQRALAELENMGLVHSQRTSGRFVSDDENIVAELKKDFARKETFAFREKMHELGYSTEDIIRFIREEEN